MIKLENVTKVYKTGVRAVNNMNVDIGDGEFVYVIGPTGAGKSTFIKLLYREEKASSGKVIVAGQDVSKIKDRKVPYFRRNIGVVFQNFRLLPKKTVFENVAFTLEVTDTPKVQIRKKVRRTLELVGLEDKANAFPHELSGGQQQRVAIARAIVNNPKVLIADEPTTALDVTIQAQIIDLLDDIRKKTGTAIVLITHDLGVVASLADRIAVMYAGKVVETGAAKDIFYNPSHPYTVALLNSLPKHDTNKSDKLSSIPGTPPDLLDPPKGCAFASRCEKCMKICQNKQPPIFKLNDGHEASCWLLHKDCPSSQGGKS